MARTLLGAAVEEIENLRSEAQRTDKLLMAAGRVITKLLKETRMIWLELTNDDEESVYVNIDAAFVMQPVKDGTLLHFTHEWTLKVIETPQQIMQLAREADPVHVD